MKYILNIQCSVHSDLLVKNSKATMLPEPDLFSSVNLHNHNLSDGDTTNPSVPGLTHLCENDEIESPKQSIKLSCHPYTGGVNRVMTNGQRTNSNSDQRERIARRWYLTVIVLLYLGLITSFCLNVTLLLKSNPEPSAARISLAMNQIHLDSKGGKMKHN